MLGRIYDTQDCSAARALEIVGERWSLLIIRNALLLGTTRFGDFQRHLGLARNVLSVRLDRFVENGLMTRRPDPAGSAYHEYVLTEKGHELLPIIIALTHWGDRWVAPSDPPVTFRHDDCGGEVRLQAVCGDCDRNPTHHEIAADARALRTSAA